MNRGSMAWTLPAHKISLERITSIALSLGVKGSIPGMYFERIFIKALGSALWRTISPLAFPIFLTDFISVCICVDCFRLGLCGCGGGGDCLIKEIVKPAFSCLMAERIASIALSLGVEGLIPVMYFGRIISKRVGQLWYWFQIVKIIRYGKE